MSETTESGNAPEGEVLPESSVTVEDQAESTTAEAAEPEKPKPDPVQRRIDRLTREKYQLKARLEELERRVSEPAPKAAEPQGAPKLEQFESFDDYVSAKAEWVAEQKFRTLTESQQRAAQEQQAKRQQAEVSQSWQQRVESARTSVPDYDEIIESADVVLSPAMGQAIVESEQGPMVALYLARHPEEAEKLASLSPTAVARAIGRIEAKLEGEQINKTQSTAPKPPSPVRGSTVKPTSALEADDYDTFVKLRRKQILARR